MARRDDLEALEPVVDALDALGVGFHIGGSVASSLHGVARATIDIDLVADLTLEHVHPLVASLEDAYYIDEGQVREAVRRRSSFNLIHLATMYKIDVFVTRDRPFDQVARRRARAVSLTDDDSRAFAVASPEDTILTKLEWYRAGGERSERQWTDIVGVIRVQADRLDRTHLEGWAARLEVADLLERALAEGSG